MLNKKFDGVDIDETNTDNIAQNKSNIEIGTKVTTDFTLKSNPHSAPDVNNIKPKIEKPVKPILKTEIK